MEGYKMRMSQAQGGLSAMAAALPPLPPSRFGRSSNQYSTPLPPPHGRAGGSLPNSEKLQLHRPPWINQSSDLNLNLHGNTGKNLVSEGVALYAPTKQDPAENYKQVFQGSEKYPHIEAKRLRRVMQSRQYSQKYRLKQLHYISQLESEVKALQAEVTITSPRIKFMDRQNSLLRAENYSIKEKLSAYTGELLFKEAQYEELKRERNMLKNIYEAYQQKLLETLKNNTSGGGCYQLAVNMVGMSQPEDLNQKPIDPPPPLQQPEVTHNHQPNPFSLLES